MSTFVIGINGGGTHTDFALVDSELHVHARYQGEATNYRNVGVEAMQHVLQGGIADVLRLAGLSLDQITAIGAGFSGTDRQADRALVGEMFENIAPGKPLALDNDAVPALVAATGRRFGVVVISGTGSIAYGFDDQERRARSGGWGYHVDKGSGYAIARETLSAIARAQDGGGLATALTADLLKHLDLSTPTSLIDWLYAPGRRLDEVAALAAVTISLAGTDLVATRIIAQAADDLATEAISVARQLDLVDEPFPLVTTGSLLTRSELMRNLFVSAVQAVLPNATPIESERDAAIGAAMMALGEHHIQVEPLTVSPKRRATEQRNRLTTMIHRRPTLDLIGLMNLEDQRVPRLVETQLAQIASLIDAVAERFAAGGRIIYVGAGTSGRLAVLDASECRPTFGTKPEQVVGIIAGGPDALLQPVEGAEDDKAQGRAAIAALGVDMADSVIGVAASGSTPYVQGALREANERGALTGSIVNVVDAPISALAQYPVVVPTGPEAIMGSTRLKAGTAQKLVLNMISTGVMVRVGRTYSNLMTNMQMSNIKLRKRAEVIVAEATGLDLAAAADLLTRCDGDMKTAIAAALLKLSPEEARQCVAAAYGNLNRCVDR